MTTSSTVQTPHLPNHHGDHAGFSGLSGLLVGLTLTIGREGDAALAARLGGVTAGDRVVDIGSGPGSAARHAAGLGATVTGVDPATVMLRLARALTRSPRVTYVEGVAEALPLPDAIAKVAWSIATVHHWPDLGTGLAEARRVLEPGGRFVAIERRARPGATGLGSHGWTDEQAAAFGDACTTAGFADVRVEHARTGRRRSVVAVVGTKP